MTVLHPQLGAMISKFDSQFVVELVIAIEISVPLLISEIVNVPSILLVTFPSEAVTISPFEVNVTV